MTKSIPLSTLARRGRERSLIAFFSISGFLMTAYLMTYEAATYTQRMHLIRNSFSRIPCDPHDQPGYPDKWEHNWRTENPECPGVDYGGRLKKAERDEIWEDFPEFRNKSLLIVGDSIGRHLLETFNEVCRSVIDSSTPPGKEHVHYGGSSVLEQKELGFKVANFHSYGMANASDPEVYKVLEKCYEGQDYEFRDRVDRFFDSSLKGFEPDYIQLNAGAWDFRYWYVRDVLNNRWHDDLLLDDRRTSALMAIQSMDYLRAKFPKAKVWYMHASMANEDDLGTRKDLRNKVLGLAPGEAKLPDEKYPPMYTYRRQSQYRATMQQMIADAGYDSLDYGKIQHVMSPADFSKPGDLIHPQWKAKRSMVNMMLTKIHRHVMYGV